MRHKPSEPIVMTCGSHLLKLPAIDTTCSDGASRVKTTDRFAVERTRNPDRAAGGMSLRFPVAYGVIVLFDLSALDDFIVLPD
jgi:hypothetical protein